MTPPTWLATAGTVMSAWGASCSVLTASDKPSVTVSAGLAPDVCVPVTGAVPNWPRPVPNCPWPCPNCACPVVTTSPEPPTPWGEMLGTAPSEVPSGTGELGGATSTYTPAVGTTATAGTSVPATVDGHVLEVELDEATRLGPRGRFHTSTSSSVSPGLAPRQQPEGVIIRVRPPASAAAWITARVRDQLARCARRGPRPRAPPPPAPAHAVGAERRAAMHVLIEHHPARDGPGRCPNRPPAGSPPGPAPPGTRPRRCRRWPPGGPVAVGGARAAMRSLTDSVAEPRPRSKRSVKGAGPLGEVADVARRPRGRSGPSKVKPPRRRRQQSGDHQLEREFPPSRCLLPHKVGSGAGWWLSSRAGGRPLGAR